MMGWNGQLVGWLESNRIELNWDRNLYFFCMCTVIVGLCKGCELK